MKEIFKKGQVVLFQGDSITDCGRVREDINSLSEGYPKTNASIFCLNLLIFKKVLFHIAFSLFLCYNCIKQ